MCRDRAINTLCTHPNAGRESLLVVVEGGGGGGGRGGDAGANYRRKIVISAAGLIYLIGTENVNTFPGVHRHKK